VIIVRSFTVTTMLQGNLILHSTLPFNTTLVWVERYAATITLDTITYAAAKTQQSDKLFIVACRCEGD